MQSIKDGGRNSKNDVFFNQYKEGNVIDESTIMDSEKVSVIKKM